jgi:hypothetical protein
MSQEMDDLLAQMKAEFQSGKSPENSHKTLQNNNLYNTQTSSPSTFNQQSSSMVNNNSSSMDNLLSEVKAELTEKKSFPPEKHQGINPVKADLEDLNNPFFAPKNSPQQNISSSYSVGKTPINNYLLDDLKSELIQEQQLKLEQQQQEQKLKLEQEKQQEELKQKRKKQALQDKAKEWLKKLDPNSDEGIWFEEFSYGYESKLDAAIDYIEALREVRLS